MEQNELFGALESESINPELEERVQREVHRMMGFLRFSPDENGVYVARCAPDHYILPALGGFFAARFGDTPWEIIDEKRGLSISGRSGEKIKLTHFSAQDRSPPPKGGKPAGEWDELWKHYHKVINNESRNNPDLQRQFMPKRYWKYIPEMENISH